MVARLFAMDGAVGLASLARDSGIAPTQLARAFVDLGARLGLDWAQSVAAVMSPSDPWERLLVAGLARDFQQMRLDFLRALARRKQAKDDLPGLDCRLGDAQCARNRPVPLDDRSRAVRRPGRTGDAGADREPGTQPPATLTQT